MWLLLPRYLILPLLLNNYCHCDYITTTVTIITTTSATTTTTTTTTTVAGATTATTIITTTAAASPHPPTTFAIADTVRRYPSLFLLVFLPEFVYNIFNPPQGPCRGLLYSAAGYLGTGRDAFCRVVLGCAVWILMVIWKQIQWNLSLRPPEKKGQPGN